MEVVLEGAAPSTMTLTVTELPPTSLRLKLKPRRRQRVRWAEDVEDNEDLCRKKSKCCCVYHAPKEFDASSDEDEPGAAVCLGDPCLGPRPPEATPPD